MKYKIIVSQKVPLTFIVNEYSIISNTLIRFKDRNGVYRTYDSRIVEIVEVEN